MGASEHTGQVEPGTQDTAAQGLSQGEEASQRDKYQGFQAPDCFCKHKGSTAVPAAPQIGATKWQRKPTALDTKGCLLQAVHVGKLTLNCREAAGLGGSDPSPISRAWLRDGETCMRKLEELRGACKMFSEKCS